MGTLVATGEALSAKRGLAYLRSALPSADVRLEGMLSLADQAVASATNFVTGVIIARACSKEELGLYMLGFSLILLMTDFQTSLITTPYMVYAPRLKGRAHARYTGSTLIHQLAFCLLTMLALLCGAFAAAIGVGPRGLGPVLWALVAVIGLIVLREFARRVCFARLKLKTAFLFDTCIGVGQVGGLLLLARCGLLSATRAYWVIGSACGIAVLWWLWSDRESYHPRMSESLSDLKKNWVFGKWVFASGLVWAISINLYPWLLAFFHGTASVGIWAACLGAASMGNPAVAGIQNFVGPRLAHVYAENGASSLYRAAWRATALMAVPAVFFSTVMVIWGGRILEVLYGSKYSGSGAVVAILALGLSASALAFGFSRALFAIERADVDFIVNFVALAVLLTLGVWLARASGPLGAAYAFLIASVASLVVRGAAFGILHGRAGTV